LRIADFGLKNPQFEIRIPKFKEWLTRPGSQQLGAKWVEVTRRRVEDFS
jgi:hypothetical protein